MKLRTALELGRVSNLPTVWTNVLAGVALSGAGAEPDSLLRIMLSMSLFYVGGMYLNDAFDWKLDAQERPGRPIPSGEVSAKTVMGAGLGMLALGEFLLWRLAVTGDGELGAVYCGVGLAAAIVLYNAWHKGNPLSPLLMGLCRVLVYGCAALAVNPEPGMNLWFGAGALLSYLIGLTYAAKQESLNRIGRAWPLLFLALPFGWVPAFAEPLGALTYFLLFAWVAYSLVFLVSDKRRNVPRAVGQFIAGIALVDAMLTASMGLVLPTALCVAGFAATRIFQRFIAGT